MAIRTSATIDILLSALPLVDLSLTASKMQQTMIMNTSNRMFFTFPFDRQLDNTPDRFPTVLGRPSG